MKSEIMKFAGKWMDLESILSKIRLRNSDKNYTLSPMQTLACLYINGIHMGTDSETRKETVRGKRC